MNMHDLSGRTTLKGRRILFIGIGFYDYEHQIAERLRELGAQVTVFYDLPLILRKGPLAGAARRFSLKAETLVRWHERKILRSADATPFDQVFVIKAINLGIGLMQGLRRRLPRAEFVLYQWDSMQRMTGIAERLPFFDRALTFDRLDAQADSRMAFRPLFYREAPPASPDAIQDIDISFVGVLHSDRLNLVRRMQADAHANGLTTYVYLLTGIYTWLRLKLRGQADGVHVRPISYARLMDINRRSRCILDLPHPAQAGLTMRAIETLGLGRKLITTAYDIVHYDLYCPQSVRVIRDAEAIVDRLFVAQTPPPIREDVLRKYSLRAWIADVIEGTPEQGQGILQPTRCAGDRG